MCFASFVNAIIREKPVCRIRNLRLAVYAAAVAAMLALSGCSSSATESINSYDNEYSEIYDADSEIYYETSGPVVGESITSSIGGGLISDTGMSGSVSAGVSESASGDATDTESAAAENELNPEKLVYTASVELETKDFDAAVDQLNERLDEVGGIIQDENFYDDTPWEYYYGIYDGSTTRKVSGYKRLVTTVRIPTANLDAFLNDIGGIGHVTSSSSYVSNITQEYYRTKSYLESYQNQLDVLLGMYEQCETIDEMIAVEQRISEVQAKINQLTTRISSYDRDVAYSTVTITMNEVTEYSDTPREQEEKSFGEKVIERVINSWHTMLDVLEHLLYFIIDIMWLLIIIGIILTLVIVINRKHKKKLMAKGVIDEFGRPIYKKPSEVKPQSKPDSSQSNPAEPNVQAGRDNIDGNDKT